MKKITQRQLLETLFDKGDKISVANHQGKWNTGGLTIDQICQKYVPLTFYKKGKGKIGKRKKLWSECGLYAINNVTGKGNNRCHEFAGKLRNAVWESDCGLSMEEQVQKIKDSGVPYTALVFSGGKSVHIIVSYSEPFDTEADYKYAHDWVRKQLESHTMMEFDKSTKSILQLTRLPNRKPEHGTGKQETSRVLELKERVSSKEMKKWLNELFQPSVYYRDHKDDEGLKRWVERITPEQILKEEYMQGNYNNAFFKMASWYKIKEFDIEQARDELVDLIEEDLDDNFEQTLNSAFQRRTR